MTSLAFTLKLSQEHIDEVVLESSGLLNFLGLINENVPVAKEIATFQPVSDTEKIKVFLSGCTCGWKS